MKRILVVEDDELMREMLTRFLEKEKYEVSAHATADQALNALCTKPHDLILSDVKMPGMDGPGLVKRARAMGIAVPVIFITGSPSDELHAQVRELGVRQILTKPLKDLSVLSLEVRNALECPGYERIRTRLDELRLDFLTEIAHELRTPITALRLSLDELFELESSGRPGKNQNLIGISQRNLSRIVSSVERQIDLLQVALGNVSVSRRLVEVVELIKKTVALSLDGSSDESVLTEISGQERIYLFTDPERLATVLQWMLGRENEFSEEAVQFRIDEKEEGSQLVIFAKTQELPVFPGEAGHSQNGYTKDGSVCPILMAAEFGLEERACRRIVEELGGELYIDSNGGGRHAFLHLPLIPPYDRREDFISPIKRLKDASQLCGKSLDLLKCEIFSDDLSSENEISLLCDLAERCRAVFAEGDAIVRGKHKGICYLALLDRCEDEIEHTINFLKDCWEGLESKGRQLDVLFLQRIAPNSGDTEALLATLNIPS